MIKKFVSIIAFITKFLCLTSCTKTTPAGFWNNFETDFLKKNITDQGLRGGRIAMYWKSNKEGTFTPKKVVDFAIKNEWKLNAQSEFSMNDIKKWNYDTINIFPLSFNGFIPNFTSKSLQFNNFPRWINTDIIVLSFKTNWILINPGTDDSNEINGFVIISKNGKEMSVYHLWGE